MTKESPITRACPNCGSPEIVNDKCQHCGSMFDAADQPAAADQAQTQDQLSTTSLEELRAKAVAAKLKIVVFGAFTGVVSLMTLSTSTGILSIGLEPITRDGVPPAVLAPFCCAPFLMALIGGTATIRFINDARRLGREIHELEQRSSQHDQ